MLKEQHLAKARQEAEGQTIKCVVWDLDHTVWDGILLEGDELRLHDGIVETLTALDQRGILNSIASRNDHAVAHARLEAFGIADYFLYPQINWNAKSASLSAIAQSINIGIDTLAFVDDQPFEREEVAFEHPAVLVFDSAEIDTLLSHPRLQPRFITDESKLRRQLYQSDIERKSAENTFDGDNTNFLRTLDMTFDIRVPATTDLQRAEELTMRTNQLNTSGYTYSYDQLAALRDDPDHLLLVASLKDKFGMYGTIGLALVEKGSPAWTIKLLLMSCRVMSRGVGSIMMSYIMQRAKSADAALRAVYIPNGRNRQMYITYRFAGFRELAQDGDLITLEHTLETIPPFPDYIAVQTPDTEENDRTIKPSPPSPLSQRLEGEKTRLLPLPRGEGWGEGS